MYWNYMRTCSTDGTCKKNSMIMIDFTEVDINFEFIYLTQKDGTMLRIDTKRGKEFSLETRINLESAEAQADEGEEKRLQRMVANCLKMYPSYSLINTSFFVAHGNIISLFDILKKQWVSHFFFEEKITCVFRNKKDSGAFNVGVYLSNGRLKLLDSKQPHVPDSWAPILSRFGTKGVASKVAIAAQGCGLLCILTNNEGTPSLYGFSRDQLFIMNDLVTGLRLST